MSNFRARIYEELDQLTQRIDKLKDFIISGGYDDLPEIERVALKEQLTHMEKYRDVLSKRASRLCN